MKKVLKATLIVTIFSVITRAIAFIYRIYISRMIGSEGMGLYQIVLSVFAVLITATSSGIPIAVSRGVASQKNSLKSSSGTVTAALVVGLSFSLVASSVLFFFQDFFSFLFADKRCMSIFVLLLPAVIFSSMYSAFRGGLWGKKFYVDYSITELVEEIITVVAGILLLQGIIAILTNIMSAVLAITLSYVGASILTIILYFLRGGRLSNPKKFFKPLLKSALPITAIRLVSTLLQSFVALIFPSLLAKSVGIEQAISEFGILMGMTFPLLYLPSTLIGSMALVLVPELASMNLQDNSKEISACVGKALNFTIITTLLIIPIYIGLGTGIGSLIYRNSTSGKYLAISGILMLPMGLSQMSSSILSSLGKEFTSFKNFLVSSIALIFCIFTLNSTLKIYSIVLGFGLSFTINSILNVLSIKKLVPIPTQFIKTCLIMIIIAVPIIILEISSYGILSLALSPFFSIAITGTIAMVCMLLLMFVFNIIDIKIIKKLIPKRKKKTITKVIF